MNDLFIKKERLFKRQNIIRVVRAAIDAEGYLEIPAPLLIRGTNPDAFLTSFEVFTDGNFQGYLTTSTEFQLLRLMAAGYEKCYSLVSNFRYGDCDRTHNPEFTMLEWEVLGGMTEAEVAGEKMIKAAFTTTCPEAQFLEYRGHKVQILGRPWERLTVHEVFKKHLGLEINPEFSLTSIVEQIKKTGLSVPAEFLNDRGLLFSYLIDSAQEKLGTEVPTWVTAWPIFQTSMAEPLPENSELADRSELYIASLEICNGFTTVSNIQKQKALFEEQQKMRVVDGKKPVIVDEKYLNDLSGQNLKAAGIAMGIDRLVMILTGASDINEVLAFGWGEL